ncbi:MAG: M1 family peptidase, partial [Oligoflexales bacterium]|nr:M1 family peptidase [Oligoflexales bacterium]
MARIDPHSYFDSAQPKISHIKWQARIDFDSHTLDATALLTLEREGEGRLELDTRDLTITGIKSGSGAAINFQIEKPDAILGSRLTIDLPSGTKS